MVTTTVQASQLTDEQLAAEAAREGSDGPAFNELFRRHRDRVWRICFRLMGNEHDAGDAAQEVFVRLFLQRAQFAGRSKYTTWLYGVAVQTCLGLRRSRGRRQRRETLGDPPGAQQPAVDDSSAREGLSLDLMGMLETLDEEDRAMVIMKYVEDYSYPELSEIFGRSVSACKMRVSRALAELRERFPDRISETE